MIRAAQWVDFPELAELTAELDAVHRDALPWLFRDAQGERPQEALQGFLAQENHVILVAEGASGTLAGAIWVYLRTPSRNLVVRPTTVAEIDALVVARPSRRQGVGSQLVRAALTWSQAHGATRTELGAYDFNSEACAFWEAMGFRPLSRRFVLHTPDA